MPQPNIISNVRSVIANLCRNSKQGTNILHTVFTDSEDYREIIESFRKQSQIKSRDSKTFPLLSHSRTPLRYTEELGMRLTNEIQSAEFEGNEIEIKTVFAEFDFNFTYISTSPIEAENFEMTYMLYKGLTEQEHVKVNTRVIDEELEYDLEFSALENKALNTENNKYFMFTGSAIVKGPFLLITGEADIIKQINKTMNNVEGIEYP